MSLRNRWLVGTCLPMVLALGLIAWLIHGVLGRTGDEEARGWLENIATRAFPELDVATFAGLRRLLQVIHDETVEGGDTPRLEAIERLMRNQPYLYFSVRDASGALLGGADCPSLLDGQQEAQGYATCVGAPALSMSRSMGGHTVTVYRAIEAGYLGHLARVVQAELLLLGTDDVLHSTLRDPEGQVYVPRLETVERLVLRPAAGTSFGTATLVGSRYRGYLETGFEAGQERLSCYVVSSRLPGVDHWIVIAVPRVVLTAARTYAWRIIAAGILIVTIGLAAYVAGFVRRVTVPLARLSEAAGRVERGDLQVAVPVSGTDELAQLGLSFNHMVTSLRDGRRELAELSRLGGMAEVATGVLHNVGNVLNSVNVSVDLLAERVAKGRTPRLLEASRLLEKHQLELADFVANDPRGRVLPSYIVRAATAVEEDRTRALAEIGELKRNVERINSVVAMQQSYARGSCTLAVGHLEAVLDDALELVQPSYARHGITVVRQYAHVAAFAMDAQRVAQVVVNLLSNAKDASIANERPEPRVFVSTRDAPEGILVEVRDQGIGVRAEDLPKMFSFGYTTKATGHGFGLHMSALAAQSMGGSLSCASEGAGHGATFTLVLPRRG